MAFRRRIKMLLYTNCNNKTGGRRMTFWVCQKCGKTKYRTVRREKEYVICATCTRRLREGGHKIPKRVSET